MHKRSLQIAGLLAASALTVQPVLADSLQEALWMAYETNPTITGARAQLRATDEGVTLAQAQGRPSASADASYNEFIIGANATGPDRTASLSTSINVPLYRGGAVGNNVHAAQDRVESGRFVLRATESSIFSEIVGAYMDVIRDMAIVDLRAGNAETLRINLEATKDRFRIGDLTRTDIAQSEARLSGGLANLEAAQAQLIRSKENYIALVGKAPVNLQSPPPLPNLPISTDEAMALAMQNNPDMLAARENVEAAFYDRKAADAGRLPTVNAFASPSYSHYFGSLSSIVPGASVDQGQADVTIGVRASIPLFQGGAAAARIRQSQALLSVAQEREIATERSVIAQTRAAYGAWQASLFVIKSSQRQVDAAALALEGVRAENTVGLRTILNILDAEQELLSAKVQLVSARRDAYVAGFTLLAAMGMAEADDLNLNGGALYDPLLNYNSTAESWMDWGTVPADPLPAATRTIDTPAQKAEIKGN